MRKLFTGKTVQKSWCIWPRPHGGCSDSETDFEILKKHRQTQLPHQLKSDD